MDKMYRVFISSTFEDLQEERKEVIQALLGIDCVPTGMEIFQATDEDQWNLIKKVIRSCDYYIVIIGSRYGSIHPQTGKSYTQMEYEYAIEVGIPILGFVYKDIKHLPWNKIDNAPKLEEFIELVKRKMVRFWKTPEDLAKNVLLSLHKVILTHPRPGWIKGDSEKTTSTSQQISSKIKYSPPIDTYPIDYWSSGLMEFANILFGGGITGLSNFFDKKLKANLPKIEITEITYLDISFPNRDYILSYVIKYPFYGLIILCIDKDFWDSYIRKFLSSGEKNHQLSLRETENYSYSGLYEMCSMFSCQFVTNLSYLIDDPRIDITKGDLLEPSLCPDDDPLLIFSEEDKIFVASQEFCADYAKFKAYFLMGTSTIDRVFDDADRNI